MLRDLHRRSQTPCTGGSVLSKATRDILLSGVLPATLAKLGCSTVSIDTWQSVLLDRAQAFPEPLAPIKLTFALAEAPSKDLVHTSPPVSKRQQRLQQQMVMENVRVARARLHEVGPFSHTAFHHGIRSHGFRILIIVSQRLISWGVARIGNSIFLLMLSAWSGVNLDLVCRK